MSEYTRHGWMAIDGRQTGDRTVSEQMLGLEDALEAAKGKTVLDLGCAEGLIGREFIRAGAAHVTGIEMLDDHLKMARAECSGLPMTFICSEIKEWILDHPDPDEFDIVLNLGIAHKVHSPGWVMEFAAKSARQMMVFRGPGKDDLLWDGWLRSKFGINPTHEKVPCHVPTVMAEQGFIEGKTVPSCRGERVQYWHRRK